MLILEVRDPAASIAFYRDLGLDLPDPESGRPVVIHRVGSGVSVLLTTSFAATYDPAWTRPAGGYQQLLEFSAGEKAVVDQRWADLVAAGHPSRMPPTQTSGPSAAMVDDPDGNVVLSRLTRRHGSTRTTPRRGPPEAEPPMIHVEMPPGRGSIHGLGKCGCRTARPFAYVHREWTKTRPRLSQ